MNYDVCMCAQNILQIVPIHPNKWKNKNNHKKIFKYENPYINYSSSVLLRYLLEQVEKKNEL